MWIKEKIAGANKANKLKHNSIVKNHYDMLELNNITLSIF